jgi:hypothetical protein
MCACVCVCRRDVERVGGWVGERLSERKEEASEKIEAIEIRVHTHSHTQTLVFGEVARAYC